jgi:hypothetical protein
MTTPGGAWLTTGDTVLMTWRADGAPAGPVRGTVHGHVLAADANAGPHALELADVICARPGPGSPTVRLAATMSRHPGCAVAVMSTGGHGYLGMARAAGSLPFSFHVSNGHGPVCRISAIFLHAWLAAGWRLWSLEPAVLEIAAGLRPADWMAIVSRDGPVAFRLIYEVSSRAVSSPSLRSTSAASGAPISA